MKMEKSFDIEEDPEEVEEMEIEEEKRNPNLDIEEEDPEEDPVEEDPEEEEDPVEEETESNYTVVPMRQRCPSPDEEEEIISDKQNNCSSKEEEEEEEDNKVKKKKKKKKKSSPRMWSYKEEITVLEGMIEYKEKKGVYPPSDMFDFLEFIKSKIVLEMSRIQLYEKVRRLKDKFFINIANSRNSAKPVFYNSHDSTLFHLSKKIWDGNDPNTNSHRRRKMKKKRNGKGIDKIIVNDDDDDENNGGKRLKKEEKSTVSEMKEDEVTNKMGEDHLNGDFHSKYPFLCEVVCEENLSFLLSDNLKKLLKEKMNNIENEDANELNKRWQKIREKEEGILLKKMKLITMHTEFIFKGIK